MSFHVGQQVECIDDNNVWGAAANNGIRLGAVYRIKSISPCGDYLRFYGKGCGWFRKRFRPIVEKKTDIGFAHEILRKVSRKQGADA